MGTKLSFEQELEKGNKELEEKLIKKQFLIDTNKRRFADLLFNQVLKPKIEGEEEENDSSLNDDSDEYIERIFISNKEKKDKKKSAITRILTTTKDVTDIFKKQENKTNNLSISVNTSKNSSFHGYINESVDLKNNQIENDDNFKNINSPEKLIL